jgi:hypothetical protein
MTDISETEPGFKDIISARSLPMMSRWGYWKTFCAREFRETILLAVSIIKAGVERESKTDNRVFESSFIEACIVNLVYHIPFPAGW